MSRRLWRRIGLLATCALAIGAVAGPSRAAGRPSFAGTWALDGEKSQFGNVPGGHPRSRTDVIEQKGTWIRQTLYLDRGVTPLDTTVYVYRVGGKPTVNRVDGRDIASTVAWKGDTLRLDSRTKVFMMDASLEERWVLSADRRTLTMLRKVKYPMGQGEQTLIFERKQP